MIGLTGNIGTGKSTAIAWLAKKGAFVLDADKVGHAVMAPGEPAWSAVAQSFGPAVVGVDGQIDRKALGAIVFGDPSRLALLEAIIHPAVLARTQQLVEASDAPLVIIEAIKLLEARNLLRLCDEVWLITASEETILRRLTQARAMDEAEARRRLAAQSPQSEKLRHPAVTRVIANDGTPAELFARLEEIWAELTEVPAANG
ncbi:MAG: dephospho-CoA kinase [Caldilineaceae bacterium]